MNPYNPTTNASNFNFDGYLDHIAANYGEDALSKAEGRKALCGDDPFLFACLYLPHHLRGEEDSPITFADCHFEWARLARTWRNPVTGPRQNRVAILSPRESGKSSWWYLILPLWAAAFEWVRFAAAFSDSGGQSETHLASLKMELESNKLLRTDFEELCKPAIRSGGATIADRQNMYQSVTGFTFAARGIDSGNLGLKVGKQRPDLIVLDDIEPGESLYSPHQAKKRLSTLQNVILPLSEFSRVVLVGTVTMLGSLMDQCSKAANGHEVAPWITEERFDVHHHHPTPSNDDGTRRSIWPAKWPLEYLEHLETKAPRGYSLNFLNRPMAMDGTWWAEGDIQTIAGLVCQRTVLTVDPAVTSKDTSDFTGLAVLSRAGGRTVVRYARGVKIAHGEPMRRLLLRILEEFPEISAIRVEDNQGKDLWRIAMSGLPVRVHLRHTSQPKEVRFARLLNRYQLGKVVHARHLPEAEEQMYAYPAVINDDVIDAIAQGDAALNPPAKAKPGVRVERPR